MVNSKEIHCENGKTVYNIPFSKVKEIKILNSLPDKMIRTNGYGGQYLCKGSFSTTGMSNLKLMLDPTNSPYILIKTKSNQYYLIGSRNSRYTKNVYTKINNRINAIK